MDETSSEAGNLVNEEKSSENSSVSETLSWQDKVASSDPGDEVVVFQLDLKKKSNTYKAGVFPRNPLFQETTSHASPRYLHFASQPPSPCIRRIVRQEIAFDRECKKLEVVWTNRGLPVDKESLCSAANKDAFDLSDLNKSLPSTPALEEHRKKVIVRRLVQDFLGQPSFDSKPWKMRQHTERFETMRSYSVSPITPRERRRLAFNSRMPASETVSSTCSSLLSSLPLPRMPASETVSSTCSSLKESVITDAILNRSMERWSRWKKLCREVHPLKRETEPASEEQKEASEERENKEKALQYWTHLGSKFAQLSSSIDKLEEKLKGRQNSDAENNLESPWILHPSCSLEAPLPKLQQGVGQCSGWDSERNWRTDFQFPDVRVPLNSPVKKEGNADAMNQLRSKELERVRQSTMRALREQSKLKAMNSFRGDMDQSERQKPPSVESPRASIQNNLNIRKEADLCLSHVKKCRRMVKHLNESVKCLRSFQSPLSLGNIKSDKVVPD